MTYFPSTSRPFIRRSVLRSLFLSSRKHGVGKLVMSSSPSTRFDGNDIDGLKEDDLVIPEKFLEASKIAGTDNFIQCGRHGRIYSFILFLGATAFCTSDNLPPEIPDLVHYRKYPFSATFAFLLSPYVTLTLTVVFSFTPRARRRERLRC